MKPKGTQPLRQREPVVIVLNADGFVEVFANDHVDVRIVNRVHFDSSEGQIAAEELVELELPHRHRQVLWPANSRAIGTAETVTVDGLWKRDTELNLFSTLDAIAQSDGGNEGTSTCLV